MISFIGIARYLSASSPIRKILVSSQIGALCFCRPIYCKYKARPRRASACLPSRAAELSSENARTRSSCERPRQAHNNSFIGHSFNILPTSAIFFFEYIAFQFVSFSFKILPTSVFFFCFIIIGSAEALPILCVSDFCERERERERRL